MYTKEYDKYEDYGRLGWVIFDPDGDFVCTVPNEHQADALLSHLNR